MAAPIWPWCALRPVTVRLALQSQSRSGGASVTGQEQAVVSPAARWVLSLTDIPIRTREQILTWRAIEGQLDGRANPIRVPIFDRARAPTITSQRVKVPFSDQSTFDDESSFAQGASFASLAAGAAVNATTIRASWLGNVAPEPGQHFSIGDRLHRIVGSAPINARTATLTIRPWLREAWPSGTPLVFDNPMGLFRLAKDDAMALDLELWRIGHPSLDLVEYF